MIKLALIIFNIALLVGISISSVQLLKKQGDDGVQYTTKKVQAVETAGSQNTDGGTADINEENGTLNNSVASMLPEEKIKIVLENSIFSQKRCDPSLSNNNKNPQSNRNMANQLRLVGTFMVGENRGAIILQPAVRMNMTNRGPNNMVIPVPPNVAFAASNVVQKQFVKVGETLSNGFQLLEVTRGTAVLSDGTNQIELELLQPSQNQGINKPNQNITQQQFNRAQNFRQQPRMMGNRPQLWGGTNMNANNPNRNQQNNNQQNNNQQNRNNNGNNQIWRR